MAKRNIIWTILFFIFLEIFPSINLEDIDFVDIDFHRYQDLAQDSNYTYSLEQINMSSQYAVNEIHNFTEFFEPLYQYVEIDYYIVNSKNVSIIQPQYKLDILKIFDLNESTTIDVTYDDKSKTFYSLFEHGIKAFNIIDEDLVFNRLEKVKAIVFRDIITVNISKDSFFYLVHMNENQTFILIKNESQILYGKLENEGTIKEMKSLSENDYLLKQMNIISYKEFLFIPNLYEGLICYKLENGNFSSYKKFYNNTSQGYFKINDIQLHPKNPDILIVSDNLNGIFYTKIKLENGEMYLEKEEYIVNQTGFAFISVSVAYNITTLVALLTNSTSREYYFEINIENLPKSNIRKVIPVYLQQASIILTNQYSIVKTVNMISILKIGSQKRFMDIGVPYLENSITFINKNNVHFLYNAKNEIILGILNRTEPKICLNYETPIKEIVNITGISNQCVNFSKLSKMIYYNENNSCNYTLPIQITISVLTKEDIKSTFQYWVILILLPILGIGGAIFWIYFKKYRKVKGDYDLLVNQSQIRTNTADLPGNSPFSKNAEGPFRPAMLGREIFKIADEEKGKEDPSNKSPDLYNQEARKTIEPMIINSTPETKKDIN